MVMRPKVISAHAQWSVSREVAVADMLQAFAQFAFADVARHPAGLAREEKVGLGHKVLQPVDPFKPASPASSRVELRVEGPLCDVDSFCRMEHWLVAILQSCTHT